MEAPIVLTKSPAEFLPFELDLSSRLTVGEEITDVVTELISPSGITLSDLVAESPNITFNLTGGADGVSYGIRLDVTTSEGRTFSLPIAVLVSSGLGTTYTIKNPEGIQTIVDQIIAGDVAIAYTSFMFDPGADLSGGYIQWDLMDSDGIVYANGNAFEYTIEETALGVKATGQGIVTVPSDVPINLEGSKYQLRWTLTLPGQDNKTFFSFENIKVVAPTLVPLGPQDTIEFHGDVARVSLSLHAFYDHVGLELFEHVGSKKILSFTEAKEQQKTPDGYVYTMYIATTDLSVNLSNFIVAWKYWNDRTQNTVFRETSRMWVINASISSAIDDLRTMINRSHSSIANQQDLVFSSSVLLAFLRMGRDSFNGAYGALTNFNMEDATSSIRQFWIYHAMVEACRSQFIAEGEKAFNFSGQAISLDVDRTQYYSTLADNYQSLLDNQCKPFKQNLIKKGIVSGTGNLENIGLRHGAIGSVGIGITPATSMGRWSGKTRSLRGF